MLKAYCQKLNMNTSARGIESYLSTINAHNSEFLNAEVGILHYGMRSKPFVDWAVGKPPLWWTANNKVKHHRTTDFNRASLKNTYNALCALEVSIIHLYQVELIELGKDCGWSDVTKLLVPKPRLFIPTNGYYQDILDGGLI